ncbi:MAG: hypothetical protein Kow0081_4330 [Candidatus Dojkabacteria bacterium]
MSSAFQIDEEPVYDADRLQEELIKYISRIAGKSLGLENYEVGCMLNTPQGGGRQLAGVFVHLLPEVHYDIFTKNSESLMSVIGTIALQHLFEVISDNLEEYGELTDEVLQIFIRAIDNADTLEEDDIWKDINALPNVARIKAAIEATPIGKGFNLLLQNSDVSEFDNQPKMPNKADPLFLLFMNVRVTQNAILELRRLSLEPNNNSQLAYKLAEMAHQGLRARYTSQLSTAKKDLENRAEGILTDYTYAAFFLGLLLEEGDNSELAKVSFGELERCIKLASCAIRLTNDLGAFSIKPEDKHNILSYLKGYQLPEEGEVNSKLLDFFNNLRAENIVNSSSLTSLLKDLMKNEPNILLDEFRKKQDFKVADLSNLVTRATEYQTLFLKYISLIYSSELPTSIKVSLVSFIYYCYSLYASGRDFDEFSVY